MNYGALLSFSGNNNIGCTFNQEKKMFRNKQIAMQRFAIVSLLTVLAVFSATCMAAENVKGNVEEQGWTKAFATRTAAAFREKLADDVVLEASVLPKPVVGKEYVGAILEVASNHYKYCDFIEHAQSSNGHTFLEWELETGWGVKMGGVTLIKYDENGKIKWVGIHHRPFYSNLLLSDFLGDALIGVVPRDYFAK